MIPLPYRLALGLLLGLTAAHAAALPRDTFDHAKHARLFPACENCHAGIVDPARSAWPTVESCASCHDGAIEKQVDWAPPTGTRPSNLRFTHAEHSDKVAAKVPADSALYCVSCHQAQDNQWMLVERTRSPRCLACHGVTAVHTSAPDTACATCHLPLPEAPDLPRAQVAKFAKPASHDSASFLTAAGHGEQAQPPAGSSFAVAPSCATCHARDFCAQCHVNAPEVTLIQALAPDPRSTAIEAKLMAPSGHTARTFLARHGPAAREDAASCANCHTRQSCLACHRTQVAVANAMPSAGPGRGAGARIERQKPNSHTAAFTQHHGPVASSSPRSCAACHTRSECLDCHRPNPGAEGSYHPAGFLVRHPAAAFSRESDCAECHNQGSFCATCHAQSGLTSGGRNLAGGYHDSRGSFLLSHGAAARQNLESCVSCHSERDCLVCHSAQTRRFNPHGPGFDPERLRKRNPQTCAACHGRDIPGD